jgi:large subunit ribosomal protein L25
METVALTGLKRTETGKKAAKALRNEGRIPCAIYGMGTAVHFSTTFKDVKSLIYTASFKIAEIELDGKTYKCIVKDKHFHPVSDEIENIEFIELLDNRKITVQIPVKFHGAATAPGVKAGGSLQQNLRSITIKTTSEHLVGELTLDVSELEIGQSVRVREIDVLEGVEVMNPGGTPVASIEVPRALRSAEAGEEGEEGEEGVEGAEGAEGAAAETPAE